MRQSRRGETGAMAGPPGRRADADRLIREIPGVLAANWNGPGQTVIAGSAEAVRKALDLSSTRGFEAADCCPSQVHSTRRWSAVDGDGAGVGAAGGVDATGVELTAISVPSGLTETVFTGFFCAKAEAVGGAGSTLGAMIGVLLVGATGLSTTVATAAGAAAAGVAAGAGGTVFGPALTSTGCSSWATTFTGPPVVEILVEQRADVGGRLHLLLIRGRDLVRPGGGEDERRRLGPDGCAADFEPDRARRHRGGDHDEPADFQAPRAAPLRLRRRRRRFGRRRRGDLEFARGDRLRRFVERRTQRSARERRLRRIRLRF